MIFLYGSGRRDNHPYLLDRSPVIGGQDQVTEMSGGNILGRWNHIFSSRSDVTLQFYFDNYKRTGPLAREKTRYHRLRLQSSSGLGIAPRQTWSGGWDIAVRGMMFPALIDQSFDPTDTALRSLLRFFEQGYNYVATGSSVLDRWNQG